MARKKKGGALNLNPGMPPGGRGGKGRGKGKRH